MRNIELKSLNMFKEEVNNYFENTKEFKAEVVNPKLINLRDVSGCLNGSKKDLEGMMMYGVDDTVKYLKLKETITELEEKLVKAQDEYEVVVGLHSEYNDIQQNKIINKYLNYGTDVNLHQEHEETMLILQKELFKKFQEVEKIVNTMEEITDNYNYTVRMLDPDKVKYHTFHCSPHISKVHGRFNLRDTVKYSTVVTTEKYNFEY